MKTGHAKVNSEVDMRINEAEVCHTMGLYDESFGIYEQILSDIPDTDVEKVETIKTRIDEIRQRNLGQGANRFKAGIRPGYQHAQKDPLEPGIRERRPERSSRIGQCCQFQGIGTF